MKRVVITGAARGLGRALTGELAGRGWSVVACVRTPADGFPPGVRVVVQDVREPVPGGLLGDDPVDVLVNNAGIGAVSARLGEVDPAGILDATDVNVAGPLRLTQAVLPNLLAAPDPLIVNVTSRLGSVADQAAGRYAGFGTSYAYRVSKAAQNMLTVALADELAGRVRCWAVHPGVIATGMGRPEAATSPAEAARRLADLLASPETASPRYVSLPDGTDIAW